MAREWHGPCGPRAWNGKSPGNALDWCPVPPIITMEQGTGKIKPLIADDPLSCAADQEAGNENQYAPDHHLKRRL